MRMSPDERYKQTKRAHGNLTDNILTLTEVFLNQKRINFCEQTYVYSILIEKDFCEFQNVSVKFPCALLVCLCLSSGDLFFLFVNNFPFLFVFLKCYVAL